MTGWPDPGTSACRRCTQACIRDGEGNCRIAAYRREHPGTDFDAARQAVLLHLEGSWPADDLRRAFVKGAEWWDRRTNGGFTIWQSDRRDAEDAAEQQYPNGRVRRV